MSIPMSVPPSSVKVISPVPRPGDGPEIDPLAHREPPVGVDVYCFGIPETGCSSLPVTISITESEGSESPASPMSLYPGIAAGFPAGVGAEMSNF